MLGRVLDDPLLLERLDRGDRRSARERVAGVGEPAGEEAVAQLVGDRLGDDHRPERDVARVDPLRDREDVGDDVPVVAGEPLAGAAEPGHHLVEDQQDPVPVAGLADRLQVAVGRDDDPVRADDRLEDDGGDRVRALVLEDLLQVRRARCRPGTDRDGRRGSGRCTGRASGRRRAGRARRASGAGRR